MTLEYLSTCSDFVGFGRGYFIKGITLARKMRVKLLVFSCPTRMVELPWENISTELHMKVFLNSCLTFFS